MNPGPPQSLYLHIPFCRSRCGYCAFSSSPLGERDPGPYISALLREAETARSAYDINTPLTTLFIGGGTPTILPPAEIERLITGLGGIFSFTTNAEITIEANPGTTAPAAFTTLAALGVNRLSLGIQSFNNATLKKIGRSHTAAEAVKAIKAARRAGFANLNLDLIRGLPGEDDSHWRHSMEAAIAEETPHLSIYDLSVEPGTSFYRRRKQLALPDETVIEAMDLITAELTAENGFARYEISNYCRPGKECRHNINYWQNRPYLGLGAGAVSFINGIRLTNTADADLYLRRTERGLPLAAFEILPLTARMRETVVMGLRMSRGLDLEIMKEEEGLPIRDLYGDTLTRLRQQGLISGDDSRIRLTAKGMLFANRVMAELV